MGRFSNDADWLLVYKLFHAVDDQPWHWFFGSNEIMGRLGWIDDVLLILEFDAQLLAELAHLTPFWSRSFDPPKRCWVDLFTNKRQDHNLSATHSQQCPLVAIADLWKSQVYPKVLVLVSWVQTCTNLTETRQGSIYLISHWPKAQAL